jgi:phosphoribosylglycinamide formyltransferase 1
MVKQTVAVLVSGSGSNLQALIDAAREHAVAYDISLVISNDPTAYALERARRSGIKTRVVNHQDFDSRQEFDDALADLLESYEPDIIALAGFMRRLTPHFVQRFRGRLINIHPSLLPAHPGLRTHDKVLSAGDERHGCSIHFVTEVLDGGPVMAQSSLGVMAGEDAQQLAQRVLDLEHNLYWRVLNMLAEGKFCLRDGVIYLADKELPVTGIEVE